MNKDVIRPRYITELKSMVGNNDLDSNIVHPIVPKYSNKNYIGIEVECLFDPGLIHDLLTNIILYNLHDKVIVSTDGSIDDDYNAGSEGYEIKLLTTEHTYKQDLFSLSECLRLVEDEVNQSCGLHVHLDCYNYKADTIIDNLNKFKDFFKSLIPESRRLNNDFVKFNNNFTEHHNWINKTHHGTVEIRCHEGTINMKEVERFINLLLIVKQTKITKAQLTNVNKLMKILNLTKTDAKYFLKRVKQFSKPKGDKYYV